MLKSAPFRAGPYRKPLSGPLQIGIRFLSTPLPASPRASLTVRLPCRAGIGLTLFHANNMYGLDLVYAPVALMSAFPKRLMETSHLPFGSGQ